MMASNHKDLASLTAALELVQLKHTEPSRTECRAASLLMSNILSGSQQRTTHELSYLAARRVPSIASSRRNPSPVASSSPWTCKCGERLAANRARCGKCHGWRGGKRNHTSPTSSEEDVAQSMEVAMVPFRNNAVGAEELPIPVAAPADSQYLSPLHCFLRQACVEYFAAASNDITSKGRQTPVVEGRVGVRCVFCKNTPRHQQASQATSFPNKISSIYSSVVMLQCRHFPACRDMPASVREHLVKLKKLGNAASNGVTAGAASKRQQYWGDSARSMGFVDTNGGIRFSPRVVDQSMQELPRPNVVTPVEPIESESINYELLLRGSTLVTLEDKDLVPDHIFLSIAQLMPCQLINDDRIGPYRTHPIGYPGMCCRHCQGFQPGPGYGKFFPNSVRSLAQTTTTNTIVKHLTSKCKHVPKHIKDIISSLFQEANEDTKPTYASRNSTVDDGRPKFGSRKMFFQRIWDRLHGCNDPAIPSTGKVVVSFPIIQPTPIRVPPISTGMDSDDAVSPSPSDDDSMSVSTHGRKKRPRTYTDVETASAKRSKH